RDGVESRARGRARVLRRVLQRVPGRARGRPRPPRERPHPRREPASAVAARDPSVGPLVDHGEPAHELRVRARGCDRRRIPRCAEGDRPDDRDRAGDLQCQWRLRGDAHPRDRRDPRRGARDAPRGPPHPLASERDHRRDHLDPGREKKGGRDMRHRIPALALATMLIAAACGGAATPSAAPSAAGSSAAAATATQAAPAKVSIMVGGLNKQIYLPNMLTEKLGYFKEQNLAVDLIDEPSGKDTTTEVVAGNVDFGSGSYDHTIDIAAAGKSITMVALLLQEPGEFVMVSKQKAATIKSPADWKGVSAGVTSIGSGTHTLMRAMTIKAGLKVSDVNFVAAGAGDTFIAAMKQGTIDVGITTQPTVLRMQKTGDGQVLVDLSKPETTRAALGGDYPFISVFAKT